MDPITSTTQHPIQPVNPNKKKKSNGSKTQQFVLLISSLHLTPKNQLNSYKTRVIPKIQNLNVNPWSN